MNLNTRKEAKPHAKTNGHYATKSDLKDTEHHLSVEILGLKHEAKEIELQLKHEIKESELKLKSEIVKVEETLKGEIKEIKGEIKTLGNSKWFDRSLAISVLVLVLTPYIQPLNTAATHFIQYFS